MDYSGLWSRVPIIHFSSVVRHDILSEAAFGKGLPALDS